MSLLVELIVLRLLFVLNFSDVVVKIDKKSLYSDVKILYNRSKKFVCVQKMTLV